MPVMGFTKFERFFRAAGGVTVDREDVKRYLDFVNDAIYDLLIIGQATAKANVRDVIEPWDLPVTKGLQESTHAFQRLEEEIELGPILESLTARPPLDATLDEETEARLPLLFGGISVALARTFKLIDAELKAVHSEEWERTFSLFRLLICDDASPREPDHRRPGPDGGHDRLHQDLGPPGGRQHGRQPGAVAVRQRRDRRGGA